MSYFAKLLLASALLAAGPSEAHADGWVVAEAPAAVAVSDAQSGAFRAGVMPALGFYTDNGTTALGVRLRAGILRNGPAPGGHLSDPGVGGLGTAGVALRFASHGLWIEGVAGGGITGRDLVPSVEAGVGWDFAAGSVDLGPSARYVRVVSRDAMAAFGSADLVLVGVDVRFGKARPPRLPRVAIAAPVVRAAPPAVVPAALERDPDRAVEREASCATDPDGCEIAQHIFLRDDRIVLDERVLFDLDRARVKSRGRELIGEIAKAWRAHPEWRRMSIEGHADVRGSDEYNLALSQHRAERVRAVFVDLGFSRDRMDAVGYGRSRPRDPGATEAAHQRNRRVEFVIEREQEVLQVGASQ
jgi:outer membrane protein OmpA-like peptidoglycan-associated protein